MCAISADVQNYLLVLIAIRTRQFPWHSWRKIAYIKYGYIVSCLLKIVNMNVSAAELELYSLFSAAFPL
jgi:hypothetical protein